MTDAFTHGPQPPRALSPTSTALAPTLAGLPVELKRAIVAHLAPRLVRLSALRQALEEDLEDSYQYGTNVTWEDERREVYDNAKRDLKRLSLVSWVFWEDVDFDRTNMPELLDFYLTLLPSTRNGIRRLSATKHQVWKHLPPDEDSPAARGVITNSARELSGNSALLRQVDKTTADERFARARQILINRVLEQCTNLRELVYNQQSWQQYDPETDGSFPLFEPVHRFLHPSACQTLSRLELSAAYDGASSGIDRLIKACPNLTSLDLSLTVFPSDGGCDLVPLYTALPSLIKLEHLGLSGHSLVTSDLFTLFFTCPLTSLKLDDELAKVSLPGLISFLISPTFRLTHLFLFISPILNRSPSAFSSSPSPYPPIPLPHLQHLVFGCHNRFSCLPTFSLSPLSTFAVLYISGLRGRDLQDFLAARLETLKEVFIGKRAGDDYGWYSSDEDDDDEVGGYTGDGLEEEEIQDLLKWCEERGVKCCSWKCGGDWSYVE
ncbi:hypothetical protein JCM6882_007536 [Rhodosporidiobolus microsporus]